MFTPEIMDLHAEIQRLESLGFQEVADDLRKILNQLLKEVL